jgi:histidinol-phosphate aminotransferase
MDFRNSAIKGHLFEQESPSYEKNKRDDNLLDCYHGINPYGPCSEVEKALEEKDNSHFELHRYPIHNNSQLVSRIEEKWIEDAGMNLDGMVRLADGAKTVLENVNNMVLGSGKKVVGVAPQYTNYIRMVDSLAADYDPVNLRNRENLSFPVDAMIKKIESKKPALVYIDNPNNPTGQFIPRKRMKEIVETARRSNTIVLVDEAYAGFINRRESSVNLTREYSNLIVARSFSKAHGLAGARSGYAVMNEDITEFYDKVRTPYKMSSVALKLSEIALENEHYLEECRKKLRTGQQRIINSVDCKVMDTNLDTPIFTLKSEDSENLKQDLKEAGILVNSGENFVNLDSSYARVRVPKRPGEFVMKYDQLRAEKETKVLEKSV